MHRDSVLRFFRAGSVLSNKASQKFMSVSLELFFIIRLQERRGWRHVEAPATTPRVNYKGGEQLAITHKLHDRTQHL